MKHTAGFLVAASLLTAPLAQADVILHAFNWKYADITAQADAIKAAGYKMVLVSPPLKSSGNEWWARYQPQDLRLIDNPLGNKQAIEQLITAMSARGIAVYADVVLNHMANETWKRPDLNYPGQELLGQYAANPTYFERQKLFGDLGQNFLSGGDFHPEGCISNWNDPYNVQFWRLCGGAGDRGLPDLDPNNWVVSQQQAYLKALKQMGFKGFRIDAVKHMSPYQIGAIFTGEITSGMHVFGEVITSGGAGAGDYETFLRPYLDATNHGAYDFPLFASIRSAFSYGGSMNQLADPGAYGQALPGSRAVTFAITHDIPTNDGFRYQILGQQDEKLAYAYLLGRDGGTPMVYSDHGETKDKDGLRWQDYWKRTDLKGMIRFHNAVQGQPQQLIGSGDCFVLFKRGKAGLVGINKCDSEQEYWLDTGKFEMNWNRNYRDVLDASAVVNVQSQWVRLAIPPRSARMWLQE
ncbi:alpha-amylase [Aeromonas schubertii]|uniref:alpha-amylase family protein n=1 Tax=Aeromonas schubertii TaxID=652 RepID=UPI00067EA953|nr:alpha-amylase family protein [Aeromonas schubertii]KUE81128.1 alpha-amylase [Aeromonas schubertii]